MRHWLQFATLALYVTKLHILDMLYTFSGFRFPFVALNITLKRGMIEDKKSAGMSLGLSIKNNDFSTKMHYTFIIVLEAVLRKPCCSSSMVKAGAPALFPKGNGEFRYYSVASQDVLLRCAEESA